MSKQKTAEEARVEIREMLARVDKERPDPAAVAKLKQMLDAAPSLLDTLGNLALVTESNLLSRSFANANSTRIAVTKYLETMRDDLGYGDADPLQRSLIAHVCMCWARLYDCELRYHMVMGESPSTTLALYWERKLSMNQRRYLRACESLARVRRLLAKPEPKPDRTAFNLLLAQQIGKR